MSLKHVLLGMLDEPASGYDLKKTFSQSLRHFWAAELSQIYPLLGRMENDGMLKSKRIASEKGPPRKTYQRTAAGTRELKKWISQGPYFTEERRHYLAQVFFLDALNDPEKTLEFMQEFREKTAEKLETLMNADTAWGKSNPGYPDSLPDSGFYKQMTLDLGIRVFSAHLDWCEEQIRRISNRS